MFLTPAELIRLTGRKYAPAQKRVLDKLGIPYTEDDFERPVVLTAAVERKHLGEALAPEPAAGPNMNAFPRLQ